MPRKKKNEPDLKRTPKALEGDETPAGYLGYDGPREPGQHDEAKTLTMDNQDKAKPLDPKMAGPDAQDAGHPVEHNTQERAD